MSDLVEEIIKTIDQGRDIRIRKIPGKRIELEVTRTTFAKVRGVVEIVREETASFPLEFAIAESLKEINKLMDNKLKNDKRIS